MPPQGTKTLLCNQPRPPSEPIASEASLPLYIYLLGSQIYPSIKFPTNNWGNKTAINKFTSWSLWKLYTIVSSCFSHPISPQGTQTLLCHQPTPPKANIAGEVSPTKSNHDVKHHKKRYCVGDCLVRVIIIINQASSHGIDMCVLVRFLFISHRYIMFCVGDPLARVIITTSVIIINQRQLGMT